MNDEDFKINEEQSGIKIGDKVKVLKSADSYKEGWGFPWVDGMNQTINKIFIVSDIDYKYNHGIRLKNSDITNQCDFYYPFFVLEKIIPKPPIKKVNLTIGEQTVEISEVIANIIKRDL